jgi:hypothetical protein
MEWRAVNTPHAYGSSYISGSWRIHHRETGFGAIAATLYRDGQEIVTFGGPEGLHRAQRYAERVESKGRY